MIIETQNQTISGNEFKLNSNSPNNTEINSEDNFNSYRIVNSFQELGIDNHQTFHELYLQYLCEDDNS